MRGFHQMARARGELKQVSSKRRNPYEALEVYPHVSITITKLPAREGRGYITKASWFDNSQSSPRPAGEQVSELKSDANYYVEYLRNEYFAGRGGPHAASITVYDKSERSHRRRNYFRKDHR